MRWVVVEFAVDGQMAGAFGPYASAKRAQAARNLLGAAIDEDDISTESTAHIVPLCGGHRELLRQIAEIKSREPDNT